ncbi:MAG: S41 family peptidase [Bacteroidia bacterium]|nr:S41 family peptidase [Bacteroidia bacterium]
MKTWFKKFRILIISAIVFIASVFFFSFRDDSFEIAKNLDIFYSLFKETNIYYVDQTDPGKLIRTGIDAMLKSLDPYTNYIPESQIEDYRFMTTGQYGGVGAVIRKIGSQVVIEEVYENSPAMKSGLKAGDIIIEVNNKPVKDKQIDDVSEALKGQPNTVVNILMKRPGTSETITKSITREEVKIKSVPHYQMLNNETGYIKLTSFTEKAGQDVKDALVELKKNPELKSVILDLRSNPGGLLLEAVNIVNLFVGKGQEVVSTKGKIKDLDKTYTAVNMPVDTAISLAILVNSGSASASEIVSGAIQDLDRGIIVGQRTFGKGLVQATRDLSYNAKLKITTAKYYVPSGRCIQALDYTHRRDDGSVGKVPDSLITQFKTKAGRKVFDGGGISPDVKVTPSKLSNIAVSLITKSMIFDYVTDYCLKHASIAPPKEFVLADADYQDFIQFLSGKEFDYESKSDEVYSKLEEISKKEKYYESAKPEFEALHKKIAHDKQKDLITFKEEIKDLISEEIVSRYYYQKGAIEYSFLTDPEVIRATEILKNPSEYRSLLTDTSKKIDDRELDDDSK